MRKRLCIPATLGLALIFTSGAWAEAPKNPEEDLLQRRAEAFVEAFNKGDAKTVASFWTPDGDVVDKEGEQIKGREAIEKAYEKTFSGLKGAKLYIRITSLRIVRPDLALEDGLSELVPPDGGPPEAARYTVVHVKEGGQWYLESVREAIAVPPSNIDNLQDLAFLIGDWAEDAQGGTSKASYTWDENRNFILNTFDVSMKDVSIAGGTQWIVWDAAAKQPRAFSFLFNGSFAEGVWNKDGNKWKIALTATMRDGKKLKATNIFTKIDDDHFSFQLADRSTDGKPLPDDKKVTMKRVK